MLDTTTMRKLLTLAEVANLLDLAPATVHRLPLPSIRLGRSLRFDPIDVEKLIEASKEPIAA
jgi:predicted DNA-binding transcriptional regulator AlpA